MVYIHADGTIGKKPWHKQIVVFFWGFLAFISAFFRTLINPALNGKGDKYERNYSQRPGDGPPRPPDRRVGRFATLSSCRAPMPGGG